MSLAVDLSAALGLSGRSWWEARYRDGRTVSEWAGALQAGPEPGRDGTRHWEDLDRRGLVGLRLLCPDGSVAELATAREGLLFQFKVGGLSVGGEGPAAWCSAHVIGAVVDADGRCVCRAWETAPGRLVEFEDNVYGMRYLGIGALALTNLGVRL